MLPIRIILHPTDFSDRSAAALSLARALARDQGAGLVLLHIAPVDVLQSGVMAAPIDLRVYRDGLEEMKNRLEGPDLKAPVEIQLRQGDPAAEILQAAEEIPCDLIVMGTHGRSGLSRLLMGSVAEAVVREARCPILTVKAPVPAAVLETPTAEPASV